MSVLVWIIYDIGDDTSRTKVAKICKQYGLTRVQYSAFLGRLEKSRLDELGERFKELIDEDEDSVYIFPFCQEDFRNIKMVGKAFDKRYVNEEELEKFF